MPEGNEETTETTEPQAEAAPEETTETTEEAQPASPPDLSDALGQIKEVHSEVMAAKQAQQPDTDDPYAFLSGHYDGPFTDEPYAEQQPYDGEQQQEAPQDDQQQQAFQDPRLDGVIEYLSDMEQRNRERDIRAIAEEFPTLKDPGKLQAVSNQLQALARDYGEEALTDPTLVRMAYLAGEAEAAAKQTSQGQPEGAQEAPAEAGGSQGPVVETGAGPGAPPEEVDPVKQAYQEALGGGPRRDRFGFPIEE